MSYKCNENSTYTTNLVSAARQNHKERSTVIQGEYMKVNVMSVPMCGEIGMEVHEAEEQLVTVVCGNATVKLGNTRNKADYIRRLSAGDSVFIPAGMWHNVCNTGSEQLKLISVYTYAGCDNVVLGKSYDWNNARTQDNGCSCAINSGC